jgi:hypothetical protein
MKRELKDIDMFRMSETVWGVSLLVPMKRELKDYHKYTVAGDYLAVSLLVPMKRELKENWDPMGTSLNSQITIVTR